MRDADLRARAEDDVAELNRFLPELAHVRNDFYLWAELGFPSGSGGGRRRGQVDPTSSAVLARIDDHDQFRKDDAAIDYAGIEDDLENIHLAVRRLTRRRLLAEQTRLEGDKGEEGCKSCARARAHDGKRLWTLAYEKSKAAMLCRWCSDFRARWGALPSVSLVQWHVRDGRNVTVRMIELAMPELVDKTEAS